MGALFSEELRRKLTLSLCCRKTLLPAFNSHDLDLLPLASLPFWVAYYETSPSSTLTLGCFLVSLFRTLKWEVTKLSRNPPHVGDMQDKE